jgi:tRNA threonylcarbamoyladenosine biosynthesis protein TsaB
MAGVNILALDASTYAGSVAVIRGGSIVASHAVAMRGEREERLLPAVEAALRAAALGLHDLGCVACGGGPGSFTSLRIAASIAKGIAVALHLPLITMSSPALIVAGHGGSLGAGRYLAVLDAMRGDAYVQEMRVSDAGLVAVESTPRLVSRIEAESSAIAGEATLIGPAEQLCALPHARGFAKLLTQSREVDIPSWEPDYGRLAEAQVKWEQAHGRPLETR